MTGLSIGQVARRTGLSVDALRLYERAGVLAGDVRRDAAGRRVYTEWDVEWLANCVLFRAAGMPLATLARLAGLVGAGSGNEAERLDLLRAYRVEVVERVDRMRECLALIDRKVVAYEAHLAAGATGDPWLADQPGGSTASTSAAPATR